MLVLCRAQPRLGNDTELGKIPLQNMQSVSQAWWSCLSIMGQGQGCSLSIMSLSKVQSLYPSPCSCPSVLSYYLFSPLLSWSVESTAGLERKCSLGEGCEILLEMQGKSAGKWAGNNSKSAGKVRYRGPGEGTNIEERKDKRYHNKID